MKKAFSKGICLFLALSMAASLLTGCGGATSTNVNSTPVSSNETTDATEQTTNPVTETTESSNDNTSISASESVEKTETAPTTPAETPVESAPVKELETTAAETPTTTPVVPEATVAPETSVVPTSPDTTTSSETETVASSTSSSEKDPLNDEQRSSINMLNYLTVLVQEINSSSNSRLFLEAAYSELINNTEPSIVDELTLDEYEKILDVIEGYRMIAVKRERLQYIYEQRSAEALRQAMPNPLSVMNVVQSGNPLKALVSVASLALDSVNSYKSYTSELDLQYLQDGWALDDEEANKLHKSRSSMFSYMVRVSRDLPKGLTLNEDSVKDFVKWASEENVTSRIRWFESNKNTYANYGEYWLVLAQSYYEKAEAGGGRSYYNKCLEAIDNYEKLDNSIFRKDIRFAQTLPYAITAAREISSKAEYERLAEKYAQLIIDNTYNSDWSLRYFAAQTYIDLYAKTNNRSFLSSAYEIAYDNVNELVAEQKKQNETYLADIKKQPTKGLDKATKKQVEAYNKLLEETREVELAPVFEPLRLNCDLLFGLANELNVSSSKRSDIDRILHPNGAVLFLNPEIDNMYRMKAAGSIVESDIFVSFDKDEFEIPAMYITDSCSIKVTVKSDDTSVVIDDWKLDEVNRNKSHDVANFVAVFKSSMAKKVDFSDGAVISISVTNKLDDENILNTLVFEYQAVVKTYVWVVHPLSFERVK